MTYPWQRRRRSPAPIGVQRRRLRTLYRAWLVLSDNPVIGLWDLARAVGVGSCSTSGALVTDLAACGMLTYAPGCGGARAMRVKLHRLSKGRVGFWIGDD